MVSTPSWLTPSNDAPAPAPAPAPATTLDTAPSTTPAADDADLPTIILYMRLLNMGAAIALMAISIAKAIGFVSPSTLILAIYATCGGLLICVLETQLKFLRALIAVNFGFLFNSVFRFAFYVVLASVTWSFDDLMGFIISGVLVAVALFNTYVLCRYPGYRQMREKIAAEEDKRIQARIDKEVRKQVVNQAKRSAGVGGN